MGLFSCDTRKYENLENIFLKIIGTFNTSTHTNNLQEILDKDYIRLGLSRPSVAYICSSTDNISGLSIDQKRNLGFSCVS